MTQDLKKMIKNGAGEFNTNIDNEKLSALLLYKTMLLEWNKKINLTAIEEDKEIVIKHFIDSFSILPHLKNAQTMIDVGTGAGFPGIPVKIACPDIEVLLMDSLGKRVTFLNEVISKLNLRGITALHSRAEDAGTNKKLRESFDTAVARAVASLPVLLEYCLPLVKVGGIFIAMKGSDSSEAAESKKALDILGGKIEDIKEFTLPFSDIKRNIIIVRKFRQVPTGYPRKAGKPTKEPLI